MTATIDDLFGAGLGAVVTEETDDCAKDLRVDVENFRRLSSRAFDKARKDEKRYCLALRLVAEERLARFRSMAHIVQHTCTGPFSANYEEYVFALCTYEEVVAAWTKTSKQSPSQRNWWTWQALYGKTPPTQAKHNALKRAHARRVALLETAIREMVVNT